MQRWLWSRPAGRSAAATVGAAGVQVVIHRVDQPHLHLRAGMGQPGSRVPNVWEPVAGVEWRHGVL